MKQTRGCHTFFREKDMIAGPRMLQSHDSLFQFQNCVANPERNDLSVMRKHFGPDQNMPVCSGKQTRLRRPGPAATCESEA